MKHHLSFWRANLVAFIAGAITVVSFAPFGFWPIAIPTLAVLFYLIVNAERKAATVHGFCFGLGLFGMGVSWVFNSIYEFGQAPLVFAIFLTVLFVLVLSLFPALVGFFSKFWNTSAQRRLLFIVLPALWLLTEWLRGWVLTGFPWLQLGYSQISGPLAGVAPYFGVLGVSWLVALCAASLTHFMLSGRLVAREAGLSLVLFFSVAFLLGLVDVTKEDGESKQITLVQGNIAQENKWEPEWLGLTIDRYVEQTRANWPSDLVIWPEVALPGYYGQFEATILKPLMSEAESTDTGIISGMLTTDGEVAWNTVVKFGSQPQYYKKRHLVPFGEYLPLRGFFELFGELVVLPAGTMRSGKQANLLEFKGLRIATSICYEDAYGNEMADMLPAANLLLNVSNDAWFGDSLAPHQHLQIAQMRSLELGREMVRANNTGVTAFISHRGEVLLQAPQFEVTSITSKVQPRVGKTPYVLWRNWGVVSMTVLLLIAVWSLQRRDNS